MHSLYRQAAFSSQTLTSSSHVTSSSQHVPLQPLPHIHLSLKLSITPPFKQIRLQGLSSLNLPRHVPPHFAFFVTSLSRKETPLRPQVSVQGDHELQSVSSHSTAQHLSLHKETSSLLPSHSKPPQLAVTSLVLDLNFAPPPQETEHAP